ncbi:MAG: efflux RND transporter periplasmic adaptor subunit [Limisphaera sp.]
MNLRCVSWLRGWPLLVGLAVTGPAHPQSLQPAPGITEAVYDGTLSLPVAGIVSRRPFREGDFVEAGQVLLELDSRLEALECQRRRLILEHRQSEYEALRRLFEQNSISVKKEELDKARADYEVARAEYLMAEEQLNRRRLLAPCAGTVAEILPELGEAVQPHQPLVRLVDTRQAWFVANVDPAWSARIQPGQTVTLSLETGPAPIQVTGTVTFLSPVVDPASGLRKVKVLFDNTQARIAPGVAGHLLPAATAQR